MVIDREIALLLSALRDGGAVAIADAVVGRLSAMSTAEDDPSMDDSEHDGGQVVDDEVEEETDGEGETSAEGTSALHRSVAIRQLNLADQVVLERLRLEAALISAIPDELKSIREIQSARGDEALFEVEAVTILTGAGEDPDSEADRDGEAREREIANDRAMNAVTALERAWSTASESTRGAILGRG